jgi:hypothetical protein
MKKNSVCALLFLVPFLLPVFGPHSAAQEAQPDEIVAEGIGQGINEQEALLAAKRDAIEKGIGQILLSQTEIENFQLKRDQIITKTIGSVKKYEVLSKSEEAGLLEIRIKAVLATSTMRQDLAAFHILIESMEKPRVMVIISENNIDNSEPTSRTAETAVIQFLKDPYEFDLVDPSVASSIRSSEAKMAEIGGDPAAAASIGAEYGAEVLIGGEAIAREAENIGVNLGGMKSVQADVAAVHISPNTAGNQAISKAAGKSIKDLLDAIIKEWQNQLNNGVALSVSVNGVGTFREKSDVVKTLEAVNNVAAVRERSWNGQAKLLQVDVVYKGTIDGFCERIDGLKMKSGPGSFAISGVKGNKISITAQVM